MRGFSSNMQIDHFGIGSVQLCSSSTHCESLVSLLLLVLFLLFWILELSWLKVIYLTSLWNQRGVNRALKLL